MATFEIPDEHLVLDGVQYEPTGEFRGPRRGEVAFDVWKPFLATSTHTTIPCLILRPVVRYRPAEMPGDYGKKCEFSNDADFSDSYIGSLCGYATGWAYPWVDGGTDVWRFCRIREEG